jgi:cell fate (sporulation/competence/biofilm development) regulator YlbF (YheA/YmcA/DUF963 family)
MTPEALKQDEAEKAFDRFRQAVAQIATVPKNGKASSSAKGKATQKKAATKKK